MEVARDVNGDAWSPVNKMESSIYLIVDRSVRRLVGRMISEEACKIYPWNKHCDLLFLFSLVVCLWKISLAVLHSLY